jgi:hypothetical protein
MDPSGIAKKQYSNPSEEERRTNGSSGIDQGSEGANYSTSSQEEQY